MKTLAEYNKLKGEDSEELELAYFHNSYPE